MTTNIQDIQKKENGLSHAQGKNVQPVKNVPEETRIRSLLDKKLEIGCPDM